MYDLSALGFDDFFERQLPPSNGGEIIPARIAAEHRGEYDVWAASGSGRARVPGKIRKSPEGPPGVGDWVLLRDAPSPNRTTVIDRVLERRTLFTRGIAGRATRPQVVAANVDRVFVVCGLDFNLRRLERFLARIWASGAEPVVILNKADLCDDIQSRVAEVESGFPGVALHVTNALASEGTGAIRASIVDGMTVALVGTSGAGKSTLVNALVGEERMRTGDIRWSDGRGRHTTTHRQLVLLPGGGVLVDTPGMRELELVDDEGLDAVFEEITALAANCRFHDCRHEAEPGCAVREALASGALDPARLDHFRKLEEEARIYQLRQDARKRREAERSWGKLSHEAEQMRRWKGDK